MVSRKILIMGMLSLALAFILSACGGGNEETSPEENTDTNTEESSEVDQPEDTNTNTGESTEMDHSDMNHSGSGDVPESLKESENPTYEVGSKVIIQEGHMEGMKGAEATIVGAYDTTAYTISYTPSTGGERVENHKWVIHEEIIDAGEEPLQPGAEVTINADHMEGMEGVTAVIDSAEETTVYMIDFTPTSGGEKVKNHKWVTESELGPVE
ncbi:YdhK family protein [Mesobacillus maritimus]|uniref:YdhK family protein n=1 Tax=Mesobacillus maritimus TaxID=1643336 RepID=UPI00203F9AC5|nr:YdhK family protein [Mesobacillus maritimus]MCM3668966.1 YdhK family protein [Mesobacillus maritimus]